MKKKLLEIKKLSIIFSKLDNLESNIFLRFFRDRFINFSLLKNINLSVLKGEYLGLVGESGSGKSLTIKSVMGLIDIEPGIISGEIDYYDKDSIKKQILNIKNKKISWFDKIISNTYKTSNHFKINNNEIELPINIDLSKDLILYLYSSTKNIWKVDNNLKVENLKIDKNESNKIVYKISNQSNQYDYGYLISHVFVDQHTNKYKRIIDKNLKEFNIPGKKISIILQDPMSFLNPYWSMKRQINNLRSIHNEDNIDVDQILSRVKLNSNHFKNSIPRELSGGQAQRAMIILSSLTQPELLIADEPTTGLDVTLKKVIVEKFKDLKNVINDISMIFISHDLDMVRKATNRMNVMYKGEIIENAKSSTFSSSNNHHPYSQKLINITKSDFQKVEYNKNMDEKDSDFGCSYYPECTSNEKNEKCKYIKPPAISTSSYRVVNELDIEEDWVKCWSIMKD